MRTARIDVGAIRREQIVEAAVKVISEQGIQNLSLSEIEAKAGMSRGQLTYYFPSKEEILLAVFDHLVELMYRRIGTPSGEGQQESGWAWIQHLLERLLLEYPVSPDFSCLQYTFLSQIGHRDDFRARLSTLYEEWRSNMGKGVAADLENLPGAPRVSPRAVASLVQAMIHGLTMQLAANSQAFDRDEMLHLCLDMLGSYLHLPSPQKKRRRTANKTTSSNGSHPATARRRPSQKR